MVGRLVLAALVALFAARALLAQTVPPPATGVTAVGQVSNLSSTGGAVSDTPRQVGNLSHDGEGWRTAGQRGPAPQGRPATPTFLTLSATSEVKPAPTAQPAPPAAAPATEPPRQPVARVTEGKPVLPSTQGQVWRELDSGRMS